MVVKHGQLTPSLMQFKAIVNSIPDIYAGNEIKSRLIKNKELALQRTVNAKVLEMTTNEWTTPKLLKLVNEDKRQQRLAEIQKQKKDELTQKLIH
jgi:hypothetical protein